MSKTAFPDLASSAATTVRPTYFSDPASTLGTKILPSATVGAASQWPYGACHTISPVSTDSVQASSCVRIPFAHAETITLPAATVAEAIVETPPISRRHTSCPVLACKAYACQSPFAK